MQGAEHKIWIVSDRLICCPRSPTITIPVVAAAPQLSDIGLCFRRSFHAHEQAKYRGFGDRGATEILPVLAHLAHRALNMKHVARGRFLHTKRGHLSNTRSTEALATLGVATPTRELAGMHLA